MKSEYNKKPIREFGRVVTGKTPPKKIEAAFGDLYPFITPRDLDGSKFIIKTERYLSEDGLASVKNNVIPSDSVLVSCIGSDMGKVSLSTVKSVTNQQINTIIIDTSKHNPEYVYYALSLEKASLMRAAGGTTMPILNKTSFENYEIYSPDKEIQDQIVSVVKPIDEKIAHNIAMNQTLEKIAQRIFKSWFIDFDPVKANAEGVPFNGLSPEIQALFPNKLVDSKTEFGLIPEGWNPSSIGVEFDVTMGQSPPGSSYNEEKVGVKFFQGRRDFSFRFPSERVYTTDHKRMAKSDDTLISVRAPVGDINMAMDDCCIGRGLGALRHKKDLTSYTYYLMQSIKPVFDKFESNGTVFGSINQNELKAIQYVAPDIKVLEEFEKVVRGLDKKIRENLLQNLNLTSIKEKILPRLITGKIQLSDAKQELKETE